MGAEPTEVLVEEFEHNGGKVGVRKNGVLAREDHGGFNSIQYNKRPNSGLEGSSK
ncbi:uncharacterized protein G2W53_023732 [Senna tora]|uniref:Uncharacterized protein n=1 Tax=Senna tora TaxID=362788 RepID=A0A834TAK2_9FABA|nr:uncharacterized protein G2W53_023732 [Senna tora]